MRHWMTVLAGTVVMSVMAETAAIAQVDSFPCIPVTARLQELSYVPFGRTQKGDRLGLNPNSLVSVRNGVCFTYYTNDQARDAFTPCDRRGVWYTTDEGRYIAKSPAAKNMLNYICSNRVSGN
ncbi:MAG: hypothetical protein NW220_07475 [Leptolyngbyaceae cyanobacterium bins.349]|nr:hypothetical protein [Leptolyngbyaceae cyanobacterium bins.349]